MVLVPMPEMASSSRAVLGRLLAMAFRARSLKMRHAGTPRRRASAIRHWRSATSIRESDSACWADDTGFCRTILSGLFVPGAVLFLPLLVAEDGTKSFIVIAKGVCWSTE